MEAPLLHCLHPPGGLLRAQHVCGRCGGEFPSMSRGAGEGGKAAKGRKACQTTGEESQK